MSNEEKINILIVDDRSENLFALEAILEPLEQNIVRASSGEEALRRLLVEEFALILLDVHMPGMDGFETAELIKKREKSRHIPIIFLTAFSRNERYVFKGYSVGAVDYMVKPYEPDILRSKVAVFVDLALKTAQVKRQSEMLVQSEHRERELRMVEREREIRLQHMEELAASQAKLAGIVGSALDGIITAHTDGKITLFNSAAQQMFGFSSNEVIGQTIEQLLTVPSRKVYSSYIQARARAKQNTSPLGQQPPELWGIRRNGEEFPLEASISLIKVGAEEFNTIIMRDITARKQSEEERTLLLIREQAARHEAEQAQIRASFLAGASTILASSLDYITTLTEVANLAVPFLGTWCSIDMKKEDGTIERMVVTHYDPAKANIAREFKEKFPPPLEGPHPIPNVLRTGEFILANCVTKEWLTEHMQDKGRRRLLSQLGCVSFMIVPMTVRGRTLGVLSFVSGDEDKIYEAIDQEVAEDLARRAALAIDNALLYREAQEAVEEQIAALNKVQELANLLGRQAGELTAIIEAMADGLFVCDRTGRLTRINAKGGELLGLMTSEDFSIRKADEAQLTRIRYPDGKEIPENDAPIRQALRGVIHTDFRGLIRQIGTGQEVQLRLSFAPIYDDKGEITGAVMVASDVTDLYHLERQRDEFLSVASHELKTPITSIKGLTQIAIRRLTRAGHTDEVDSLRNVDVQINRLTALIGDLLDVSRLRTGKLDMKSVTFNFAELVRRVTTVMEATTEKHKLIVRADDSIEVQGDPDRLDQVLTNLIGNSIKYSPEGGTIEVRLERIDGEALLTVTDQGIGIPEEDRQKLFERFHRASNVNDHKISGFGLGLFISSEIVHEHHGRIWLEDTVPVFHGAETLESGNGHLSSPKRPGSTFRVALPVV